MNTGPIFVVGMNGSGTTMLADCLGRHLHMTGVRSCNAESTGDHTLSTDALMQDLTPIRCAHDSFEETLRSARGGGHGTSSEIEESS